MPQPCNDTIEPVVLALAESIDTPRSLAAWLCFKYNQEELVALPAVSTACSVERFTKDYFITEYLKKYRGLKLPFDTRDVALRKWIQSEEHCGKVNSRFRELQLRPSTGRVSEAIFAAQRKIAAVLGNLRLPILFADCKWGPGSTFDLKGQDATSDKKISEAISVTVKAAPYLRCILEADPHWASVFLGTLPEGRFSLLTKSVFKYVRGSRFLTVPKNAKTDRCIAAEPTGNSFLQQGIRSYIRRRLKRFGIDLDKQSINQQKALEAFDCGLSTLDLSAASDTISTELIFHLLPVDWALLLNDLRSPETYVDGEWKRTEKFVSMGNAFCFELESLIFWALASSAEEIMVGNSHSCSVYGDDIIVDRKAYDFTVEVLDFCGFTVNADKSFKDGSFYESCGKHYFRGIEVTPVYQKEVLQQPSEVIRAHNRLIRWAYRNNASNTVHVTSTATRILSSMFRIRPFPRIPFGVVEDGGFLRPLTEFSVDRNHGYKCRVYDFEPRYTEAREHAMYAYRLRRAEVTRPSGLENIYAEQSVCMNALPSGHVANTSSGKWRSKTRYIPESSLTDLSFNESFAS